MFQNRLIGTPNETPVHLLKTPYGDLSAKWLDSMLIIALISALIAQGGLFVITVMMGYRILSYCAIVTWQRDTQRNKRRVALKRREEKLRSFTSPRGVVYSWKRTKILTRVEIPRFITVLPFFPLLWFFLACDEVFYHFSPRSAFK